MTDERLMTLEEVAHRLAISYTKTRMLVLYEKAMPYQKVGARGVRVKEADFEAYITSKQQTSEKTISESQDTDPKEPYEGRRILEEENA